MDLSSRDRLPLAEAAKEVGRTPKTLNRWASDGLRGVRLRVLWVGKTPYTSMRWLGEFFEAVSAIRRAELEGQVDQ
ncbi:MAG: hypothetical protein AB7K24_16215 [Gemmataceae bacterium]